MFRHDDLPDLDQGQFSKPQLSQAPTEATEITINPKADGPVLDLQCPDCGETIEGVGGACAEYHCGCDELRRFRIRGSRHDYEDEDEYEDSEIRGYTSS